MTLSRPMKVALKNRYQTRLVNGANSYCLCKNKTTFFVPVTNCGLVKCIGCGQHSYVFKLSFSIVSNTQREYKQTTRRSNQLVSQIGLSKSVVTLCHCPDKQGWKGINHSKRMSDVIIQNYFAQD